MSKMGLLIICLAISGLLKAKSNQFVNDTIPFPIIYSVNDKLYLDSPKTVKLLDNRIKRKIESTQGLVGEVFLLNKKNTQYLRLIVPTKAVADSIFQISFGLLKHSLQKKNILKTTIDRFYLSRYIYLNMHLDSLKKIYSFSSFEKTSNNQNSEGYTMKIEDKKNYIIRLQFYKKRLVYIGLSSSGNFIGGEW